MFDVKLGNSMLLEGLYVHLILRCIIIFILLSHVITSVCYYIYGIHVYSRYHLFMFNVESITALVIIGFAVM